MALVAPAQNITDFYLGRYNVIPATGVYDALVSDLAVNDFLPGPRAIVTATGATTGNPSVRALTLRRPATGAEWSVSWPAASAVRVLR